MYVKDRMIRNPYYITKETSISTALDIMKDNGFHRLPVIEKGKLVGLITEGVIAENSPSKATSLSMYELNYLLSKTKVEDIMVQNVKTISPNAFIEEAANLMRKENIACLPVVEKDAVVGIITQNDIFDAMVDLLGYNQKGIRLMIKITVDKKGILNDITKILADAGAQITNQTVYHTDDVIMIMVICFDVELKKALQLLTDSGYDVKGYKHDYQ